MKFKERWNKFKYYSFSRRFIFSTIIIALLYLGLNVVLTQFWITAPFIFDYNPFFIVPALIMNIIIAIFVGANLNLFYAKVKELKEANIIGKQGGATLFGTFVGLLGGVCPGCVTGLFPALFALVGINTSLSVLPFNGLELQAAGLVLLVGGAYYQSGPNVCKIKIKK